jgi:hypothetical protein
MVAGHKERKRQALTKQGTTSQRPPPIKSHVSSYARAGELEESQSKDVNYRYPEFVVDGETLRRCLEKSKPIIVLPAVSLHCLFSSAAPTRFAFSHMTEMTTMKPSKIHSSGETDQQDDLAGGRYSFTLASFERHSNSNASLSLTSDVNWSRSLCYIPKNHASYSITGANVSISKLRQPS